MAAAESLRILHCFRAPAGGVFRHVRDLARAQSAAGHEVGILCNSAAGGRHDESLFDGIRPHLALGITRLPIGRSVGPADVLAILRTARTVGRLRPDILHGHGAKGGVLARVIGMRLRLSGSRVTRLYSPHGGSLHHSASSVTGRLYFRVERFLERWTDGIVFVSEDERRTYTKKIGKPRTAWRLIRNGLDDSDFEPVAEAPDAADFLFIGEMRSLKGPDVFIEAFAKAEARHGAPLSAVMVGDGGDKERCRSMIAEKGVSNRVKLLDAMPAREAFRLGRIVCMPSRAEAMPYVVLETLAAGKPIIASRVGGIPEVLGEDSPALVPPGDSAALAEAMVHGLEEPAWLAAAMPDREAFRAEFSAEAMAGSVMALYRQCRNGTVDAVRG